MSYTDALDALDALTPTELLRFHREVSRRASAIYAPMYAEKQRAGYEIAMAARDPRLIEGCQPASSRLVSEGRRLT